GANVGDVEHIGSAARDNGLPTESVSAADEKAGVGSPCPSKEVTGWRPSENPGAAERGPRGAPVGEVPSAEEATEGLVTEGNPVNLVVFEARIGEESDDRLPTAEFSQVVPGRKGVQSYVPGW